MAKPGWSLTLLDSIQKKLRAVEGFLPVLGASVVARLGRAEEIARVPDFREKFDVALCRAVGPLSEVLELTLPFVRPGGFCFLHRGVEARTEAEGVGPAINASTVVALVTRGLLYYSLWKQTESGSMFPIAARPRASVMIDDADIKLELSEPFVIGLPI